MNTNSLDLRAYSLLLDEERRHLNLEMTTAPCDILTEPTHRLDEHLTRRIRALTILQGNINYVATKIRHIKEENNL